MNNEHCTLFRYLYCFKMLRFWKQQRLAIYITKLTVLQSKHDIYLPPISKYRYSTYQFNWRRVVGLDFHIVLTYFNHPRLQCATWNFKTSISRFSRRQLSRSNFSRSVLSHWFKFHTVECTRYIVYVVRHTKYMPFMYQQTKTPIPIRKQWTRMLFCSLYLFEGGLRCYGYGVQTHKSDFGCTFRLGQINKGEFFKQMHTCFFRTAKFDCCLSRYLYIVRRYMLVRCTLHIMYLYCRTCLFRQYNISRMKSPCTPAINFVYEQNSLFNNHA